MTKNTAYAALVADVNAAQEGANKAANGFADLSAHLVAVIVEGEASDNYPRITATHTVNVRDENNKLVKVNGKNKTNEVVCTIDRAMLQDYAQGKLSKDAIGMMTDTLAQQSPAVLKARKAYAELMQLDAQERALFAAEIEAAKSKSVAATQVLQRPLRMAALMLTDTRYNPATCVAKLHKGSRVVMVDRTITAGETTKVETVSVSQADMEKQLTAIATKAGNAPKKRATKGSVAQQTKSDNGGGVLETVKKAGDKPVAVSSKYYAQLMATTLTTCKGRELSELDATERKNEMELLAYLIKRHGAKNVEAMVKAAS